MMKEHTEYIKYSFVCVYIGKLGFYFDKARCIETMLRIKYSPKV